MSYQLHERDKKLPKEGIMAPIALFVIILGVQTAILFPFIESFEILSPKKQYIFVHSAWFVAGIPALIYSLIRLKALLKSTIGDKILYFLLPSIFIVMMGVGVINLIN